MRAESGQSEERWLVSALIFPSFFALFLRSKVSVRNSKPYVNTFPHDVDSVVEVLERGKAVQYGRFNAGGNIPIF
jgi:hypothetical protein